MQRRKVTWRRWKFKTGGTPALILEGLFLEKLGFKVGDYFIVDYQPKRISIVPASEEVKYLLERK